MPLRNVLNCFADAHEHAWFCCRLEDVLIDEAFAVKLSKYDDYLALSKLKKLRCS